MRKTIVLIMVLAALCVFGCDENKSGNSYYHVISRINPDGTVDNWTVVGEVNVGSGFISWKDRNGGKKVISGTITITPFLIEKPKQEPETQTKE